LGTFANEYLQTTKTACISESEFYEMKAKKIKKELDIYDTTQMRSEGNQKWKEVQQNSVNREYWS